MKRHTLVLSKHSVEQNHLNGQYIVRYSSINAELKLFFSKERAEETQEFLINSKRNHLNVVLEPSVEFQGQFVDRECCTCSWWEPFSDKGIGTCCHPSAIVHLGHRDEGLTYVKPSFRPHEVCSRWSLEKAFDGDDPLRCKHGVALELDCEYCDKEEK